MRRQKAGRPRVTWVRRECAMRLTLGWLSQLACTLTLGINSVCCTDSLTKELAASTVSLAYEGLTPSDNVHVEPQSLCSGADFDEDAKMLFETSDGIAAVTSFDKMGLKEDLLRGIYGKL